jgi:hypothetical protein
LLVTPGAMSVGVPGRRGRQAPIGHLGLLFQRHCQFGEDVFSDLIRVASLRGSGADGYMVTWTGWVPPVTVSSPSRGGSRQAAQMVRGWKSAPQVCQANPTCAVPPSHRNRGRPVRRRPAPAGPRGRCLGGCGTGHRGRLGGPLLLPEPRSVSTRSVSGRFSDG